MSRRSKEMRDEYDFSQGIRAKHVARLRNGHRTVVNKKDGSIETSVIRPVILDPDVRKVFTSSKAVNRALRGLIELVPQKASK